MAVGCRPARRTAKVRADVACHFQAATRASPPQPPQHQQHEPRHPKSPRSVPRLRRLLGLQLHEHPERERGRRWIIAAAYAAAASIATFATREAAGPYTTAGEV